MRWKSPLPGMRTLAATRYVQPLREGARSRRWWIRDGGGLFVVKFRGAGQGAQRAHRRADRGAARPAAGAAGARAGAHRPRRPFGASEPDPEIQDILRKSHGMNLGLRYLDGAFNFDPPPPGPGDPGSRRASSGSTRWSPTRTAPRATPTCCSGSGAPGSSTTARRSTRTTTGPRSTRRAPAPLPPDPRPRPAAPRGGHDEADEAARAPAHRRPPGGDPGRVPDAWLWTRSTGGSSRRRRPLGSATSAYLRTPPRAPRAFVAEAVARERRAARSRRARCARGDERAALDPTTSPSCASCPTRTWRVPERGRPAARAHRGVPRARVITDPAELAAAPRRRQELLARYLRAAALSARDPRAGRRSRSPSPSASTGSPPPAPTSSSPPPSTRGALPRPRGRAGIALPLLRGGVKATRPGRWRHLHGFEGCRDRRNFISLQTPIHSHPISGASRMPLRLRPFALFAIFAPPSCERPAHGPDALTRPHPAVPAQVVAVAGDDQGAPAGAKLPCAARRTRGRREWPSRAGSSRRLGGDGWRRRSLGEWTEHRRGGGRRWSGRWGRRRARRGRRPRWQSPAPRRSRRPSARGCSPAAASAPRGDGQSAAPGGVLTDSLAVRVAARAMGNPVSGHSVAWAVTAGGGERQPRHLHHRCRWSGAHPLDSRPAVDPTGRPAPRPVYRRSPSRRPRSLLPQPDAPSPSGWPAPPRQGTRRPPRRIRSRLRPRPLRSPRLQRQRRSDTSSADAHSAGADDARA